MSPPPDAAEIRLQSTNRLSAVAHRVRSSMAWPAPSHPPAGTSRRSRSRASSVGEDKAWPVPSLAYASNPASVSTLSLETTKKGSPPPPSYPPSASGPSSKRSRQASESSLNRFGVRNVPITKPTTASHASSAPFGLAIAQQHYNTASSRRAFLRHSWNRIDFIAVGSFWISFALSLSGVEASQQLYIFRALSILRAARLLTITAGTSVRLRSPAQHLTHADDPPVAQTYRAAARQCRLLHPLRDDPVQVRSLSATALTRAALSACRASRARSSGRACGSTRSVRAT